MNISFELSVPFAVALGEKTISLTVEQDTLTLNKAIALIFERNPEFLEKLMVHKMLKNGMMVGMFISNNQLIDEEAILTDGAFIKVMSPICGG